MSLTQLTDLQPTNIKVTGIATFDQTVGIAGTLTYEDVTNVDSIGIITARNGINVSGGNLTVGGSVEIADSIIHTGDTNTAIRFPANDTITAETGGAERLRITSGGSIGIGTDDPQQDIHILKDGLSRVRIETTSTTQNADIIFQNPNGLQGVVGYNATKNSIDVDFRNTTDAITFSRSGSERLRITSAGSVGVGTTNPLQRLHVKQGSTTTPAMVEALGAKSHVRFQHNAGSNYTATIGSKTLGSGNIGLTFDTGHNGDVQRMTIDVDGNVGIGEESPATILHVKANVGDLLRLDRNNTGAVGNQIAFRHSNSGTLTETGSINCVSTANADTGELRFYTKASGGSNTERVRIKSDGTVVFNNTINTIHTNSNDSKLVLFGGSSNSVSNGGVLSLHGITHSGGNYTDLSAGTGGHIQFRSGTSEKFRITAGGEVLCGLTTTGTDATRNTTLHAGTMMRVSNFYMGRVHQSSNNGNAAIVLHKLGQNQGFQMSGSMTFHSYTGSAYLSGCIVSRYNNDDVTRDVSLQKANSGMNLQLVEGTISGVSGTFLAIKKNGGGTGVCYINGFFGGNIEAYGGIREVSNSDWTTTTVHGTGITGGNDSSSS